MNFIIILVLALANTFQSNNKQNLQEYQFKSGMIRYKLEGRINGTELIYFDDYGKSFYDLKTIDNDDSRSENITLRILRADTILILNNIENAATESVISDLRLKTKHNIIYPELLFEMGYKKTAVEEVSGTLCDKYTGENGSMWVWNNIILKSEMEIMGIVVKSEAVEIITGIDIPKTKFQISGDYKINKQ
ncbi:MAG: hypothetical protein GXO88_02180 [Chlorobi bacterium]|nr:hypothetical protein [Chlorobiota bacterium]